MATKKIVDKTPTARKTPPTRFVAVNGSGTVYVSNGPAQIVDYEYCVWLSKEPNNWTSEHDDAKYKVICVGEYNELCDEPFVCDEATFVELYPTIPLGPGKKVKTKKPDKQIKFCL